MSSATDDPFYDPDPLFDDSAAHLDALDVTPITGSVEPQELEE